jgi:hypothetical protein
MKEFIGELGESLRVGKAFEYLRTAQAAVLGGRVAASCKLFIWSEYPRRGVLELRQ